jgi:hypothetical protein
MQNYEGIQDEPDDDEEDWEDEDYLWVEYGVPWWIIGGIP